MSERRKQSPTVTRQLADFLAKMGKLSEEQYLDMRGDVRGEQQAKAIASLIMLDEGIGSTIARLYRGAIERISISRERLARKEITDILQSSEFGEPREVAVGGEMSKEAYEEMKREILGGEREE